MTLENNRLTLPLYEEFYARIAALALPISPSELHGTMCGYLCAGGYDQGESYIRALMQSNNSEANRAAAAAMFEVYSVSQQQLDSFDFGFAMLLPGNDESLRDRAQAFSEWCEGFVQGLTLAGVSYNHLEEEEAQDALQHITEFAELDYHDLNVNEEDEKALLEVSEYTRMAVLRLHGDLMQQHQQGQGGKTH